MGTIVEVLSDAKGIVWPKEVAPFAVHLVSIVGKGGDSVKNAADKLYADLTARGVEVLYDDRDVSAGNKLGDAELMGMPNRIVISEKTLANNQVEVSSRANGEVKMVKLEEVLATVA
jgi:prolyl-tRNA synthetase